MKIVTEIVRGHVRLSFVFAGTHYDKVFADRVAKALARRGGDPAMYAPGGDSAADVSDDVFKVSCAFKSAFLACRALEEAKSVRRL